MPVKKVNGLNEHQVFADRMDWEEKLEEFREETRVGQKEHGLPYAKARTRAQKLFGKKSAPEERALYWKREASRKKQERKKRLKGKSMTDLFALYPASAELDEELNWVKGHPKLMAKVRGDVNEDGKVIIDISDIINCEEPPPSTGAVIMLQNAVDNPQAFYKDLLKNVKVVKAAPKPVEKPPEKVVVEEEQKEDENIPVDVEMSLDDAERILRELE